MDRKYTFINFLNYLQLNYAFRLDSWGYLSYFHCSFLINFLIGYLNE